MGPQYRSCLILPFWRLEFLSGAHIFGEKVCKPLVTKRRTTLLYNGLAFIQRLHALCYSHNKHSVKLLPERLVFVRRRNVHFAVDVAIHKYCMD